MPVGALTAGVPALLAVASADVDPLAGASDSDSLFPI